MNHRATAPKPDEVTTELNCRDLNTAIASTATILGMEAEELRSAVTAGASEVVDPPSSLRSVLWFHATRIPTTTTYQDGLLPTPAMRPRLLGALRELAISEGFCSEAEWQAHVPLLSSEELAWKHSLRQFDDGPHGFLVREVILDPGDIPVFDYTSEPEYIRCLCSGFPGDLGAQLLAAYKETSRPAIVPFRSRQHLAGVLPCALRYIRAKLLGRSLYTECNRGFSGEGHAIPSHDVFPIEWLHE